MQPNREPESSIVRSLRFTYATNPTLYSFIRMLEARGIPTVTMIRELLNKYVRDNLPELLDPNHCERLRLAEMEEYVQRIRRQLDGVPASGKAPSGMPAPTGTLDAIATTLRGGLEHSTAGDAPVGAPKTAQREARTPQVKSGPPNQEVKPKATPTPSDSTGATSAAPPAIGEYGRTFIENS